MNDKMNEKGAPLKYYVFGFLVVLALVFVTVIPSSMVYRLRLFDALGLPEWLAESIRFVIIIATPFAVLATGMMRLFSVSDKGHAKAMTRAAVLEGVACVLEIIASLILGNDVWALGGQAAMLGGAIACVFGALVLTLSENGFYKLVAAQHERTLNWHREFNQLFQDEIHTPEAREAMKKSVVYMIRSESENMAGRQLFDPADFDITSGGNGNHQYNETVEPVESNRKNLKPPRP